jgi:hypothetical protein
MLLQIYKRPGAADFIFQVRPGLLHLQALGGGRQQPAGRLALHS